MVGPDPSAGSRSPACPVGRHGPAGHDRWPSPVSRAAHRRRADDRPGRDHPGPDPRPHARSRPTPGRPSSSSPTTWAWWPRCATGWRSCTPARSSSRPTRHPVRRSEAPVHPGPDRLGADPRRGQGRADDHPGLGAEPHRPARACRSRPAACRGSRSTWRTPRPITPSCAWPAGPRVTTCGAGSTTTRWLAHRGGARPVSDAGRLERRPGPGREPVGVLPAARRPPPAQGGRREGGRRRQLRDPSRRDARPGRGVRLRQDDRRADAPPAHRADRRPDRVRRHDITHLKGTT